MISRIIGTVVRRPWHTLVIILGVTAVFGLYLPKVEFSNATDSFFMNNDPKKTFFDEVKKVFGHDGVTVVAMVSPPGQDLFEADRLLKLKRVTKNIERVEGVRKVVSLVNADRIYGSGMTINVRPLMPEVPQTDAEWALLKNAIDENPMYERNLVSHDRRTAAINVFLNDFDKEEERYYEIMDNISAILNQETGPEKFYVSGIAATTTETNRAVIRDLKMFLPLTFLLIVIILAVSFRSVWGVMLPLATVAAASVWTVGFMAMVDIPLSMVTILLPPLIVAIGNAYAIHVMSEYIDELEDDEGRSEIVASALNRVSLPILICGLTTMVGFGSLSINRIPSIQYLGLASVAGVLFSVVLALTMVPAALVIAPKLHPFSRDQEESQSPGMLDEALASLAEFDLRHRVLILGVCTTLVFIGIIYAFRMDVNTDFLSFFKKDAPVSVSNRIQQEHLAGAAPFFVIIDYKERDKLKDPRMLRRMEIFQAWMTEGMEGIDLTLSINDYVKLLNKAFHKNDPSHFRIPKTQKQVAQLFLFYSFSGDPQDFAPYISPDYSRANIMVRSRIVGSTETEKAIEEIERYGKRLFSSDAEVRVTGTIRMINSSANEVARGQVRGILTCLGAIFIVMSLLFLSPRVGFLAMLPNLLPIIVLFGVMGMFGVPLNFSTSLIACIAIGLGVDDTIHFMSRYNDELKTSVDPEVAVRRTVQSVGKPVVLTSLSLFFGFTIIAGSEFIPIRQFGILTGMSIMVCLVTDLVMLPALVTTVRIRTLWDYVDLKLSGQTEPAIRLFQGLTPHQAKVATLMSVFGFYTPGEEIIKQGETVKDMFVVLEGRVVKHENGGGGEDGDDDKARVPEGLEFGCLPGAEPFVSDSSYLAETTAKILIINPMSLDRLKNSHPAIAETIIKNLDRISLQWFL